MPREIFPGPAELHERVVGILRERAPGPARLRHASDAALRGASAGELGVERARKLRSEIVNTDVGPVFVRCSVSGNEPAVILLHDAGSSSRSLEPVARGLAGGRKVILLDLPGHGETGALHLRDYSAERLAGLVVDVMHGLAIRSASVVALGAAGAIAVAMARANSGGDSGAKMIRDLVLIDPWLFEPAEYDRMIADYAPELTSAGIRAAPARRRGIAHATVNYSGRGMLP